MEATKNPSETGTQQNSNDPPASAPPLPLTTVSFTPQQVLKLYSYRLTPFEREEILAYPQLYFIGSSDLKRDLVYDNPKHFYLFTAHDHIAYRYEMLQELGKGSFGQVS